MSTTIEKLLDGVYVDGSNLLIATRRGETTAKVLDGLTPKRPPAVEGIHRFTPEELLTLTVDVVGVNGRVVGYQRDLDLRHARRVAHWLRDGKPLPTMEIALDGHGKMYLVDGQHRAAAGVIARVPVDGLVRRLSKQEQAELFFSQRRAKTLDPNVLVLAGTGPFDRYVQAAVASHSPHPWSPIVSASRRSKTKIGPYAMFQLLIRYVANTEAQGATRNPGLDQRWDRELADELAPLISCFGNKQTHPLAFRPSTLQSIGGTALWVFRRRDRHPDDYMRWQKHMPLFPFEQWVHVRTQTQMTSILLDHWNKRLSEGRRVYR